MPPAASRRNLNVSDATNHQDAPRRLYDSLGDTADAFRMAHTVFD
jgi:hypothetical protein